MKKSGSKRRIVRRPIKSLKSHRSQADLFGLVSDVEIEQLADDMKRNGQRVAIEILPDGTIVCGHQRVRAAKLLGWEEIRCWVRDDLEKAGDVAIDKRLIEDNLNRRQMTPLAVARCYLHLREMERDGWNAREDAEGDLRDHLADRFNLSGRQLDRYAKMLDAPIEIQRAFERGELGQNQVLAVVKLDADEQHEIAKCIEDGEAPVDVVKPYMQRAGATAVSTETVVFQLVRALDSAEQHLTNRFDEILGMKLQLQVDKLESGQRFIQKLHKRILQAIEYEESIDPLDFDE